MHMNNLTPNLMVEDVDRTIRFYRDILGFELSLAVPGEDGYEWAFMKCNDVELMFQSRFSLVEEMVALKDLKIGGSFTLYFEIAGIEDLYAKVKEKAEIVLDLHPTFYGMMEFAIKDCNGYILVFSEKPYEKMPLD